MVIQKLGIRASCDHCGEQGIAGTEKELSERLGWRVIAGKGKQVFCTMGCESAWIATQLHPQQTSLDDVMTSAESSAADLPPDPAPVPDAFRDAMDEEPLP